LKSLSFLAPINYIEGLVLIKNNPALSDCCGLTHLIDDDPFFGSNNASFIIDNNPFSCNKLTNIQSICSSTTSTCDDISISTTNNKITVLGLTAPNEIIKIFDENYTLLFSCFGDCETMLRIEDLPSGTYQIYVNFYNETWIPICETIITVDLGRMDASVDFSDRSSTLEATMTDKLFLAPNPALGTTFLDLKALENQSVQLYLVNQFCQKIWQHYLPKVSHLSEKIDVSPFPNGLYFLHIQPKGRKAITKKLIINRLY